MQGGGSKGGSAKTPSAGQLAAGQNAYSVYDSLLQQQANMVNQTTPWGTVTYTPTAYETVRLPWGKNESDTKTVASAWQANTQLTPEAQGLLNSYMSGLTGLANSAEAQRGRVEGMLSSPWQMPGQAPTVADLPAMYNGNFSGLPGLTDRGNMPMVDEGSRDNMLKALMALQDPQIAQDRSALATRLANQGVTAGSQAYTSAMRDLEDQVARNRLSAVTTAADQARADATFNLASRGQADQYDLARRGLLFGEEAQKQAMSDSRRANEWNIADAARGRQINESLMQRQVPLSEYMSLVQALTGGTQSPTSSLAPVPQTQIQVPNYVQAAGLSGQDALARSQLGIGQMNSLLGGLFGLGGALGAASILAPAASDRRVKRDIRRVGSWRGLPLYAFKYLWSDENTLGVMADEVELVSPAAVTRVGGIAMVNYAEAGL